MAIPESCAHNFVQRKIIWREREVESEQDFDCFKTDFLRRNYLSNSKYVVRLEKVFAICWNYKENGQLKGDGLSERFRYAWHARELTIISTLLPKHI